MGAEGRDWLADPTRMKPMDAEGGLLQVVVETPKGSRNKFAFDPEQGVFVLRKVLPAGMVFPYDFGFLPRTCAEDGDPIDVLLLMDEPAFAGCLVKARLIGVIEGEATEGERKVRNDRLLAVAAVSHIYSDVKALDDLPGKWLKELESFFVHYLRLEDREYTLLGCKDSSEAMALIEKARRAAGHGNSGECA